MIKFLIKGLIRDRSRSLFPVLMVAAGVFITVLLQAWINGAFDNMFDTAVHAYTMLETLESNRTSVLYEFGLSNMNRCGC